MALKTMTHLSSGQFGWDARTGDGTNYPGLKDIVKQLRGIKQTVIDGGAAGNHTLTGIATEDHLISVVHIEGSGTALTGAADLTAEFSITAADTINNTGGTSSADGVLVVLYFDFSAGA